jgi:hypothetical protein
MTSESAPPTVQSPVQCRMIRSKWMFIEAEPDPTVPRSGGSICWCVHTQKCMGPDGQIVTPEACNSERPCYQAL